MKDKHLRHRLGACSVIEHGREILLVIFVVIGGDAAKRRRHRLFQFRPRILEGRGAVENAVDRVFVKITDSLELHG